MRSLTKLVALCATTAISLAACSGASQSSKSSTKDSTGIVLNDAAGRKIELDKKPERVVLGESRQAYSLLFLNKKDPTQKVVAWGTDMKRAAPDVWNKLVEKFPKANDIPTIGSVYTNDLSIEGLIAHKPDIFLITLDAYEAAKKSGLADKLDSSGIKYAVTDFRYKPLENTTRTVTLLGKVFGYEKQAEKFNKYYAEQVEPVLKKGESLKNKPTSFLWRAPSISPCCNTYSTANFGAMLTAVGTKNISDDLLAGQEGALTPEQIITSQPNMIVATGGEWGGMKPKDDKVRFLHLGYNADPESARNSLLALRSQPGFDHLKAYDDGRVHGVYHQFYDAPYNFVAIQAFAKWAHPQEFADLDPQANWKSFHDRFMPWPVSGTFITSIK
ncbi:ABC transporter substrate-binding protein [Arcanobacterium bovis]|uniref:Prevent-host-death protein n=1 Tax=Arcanobacterium bovis TaxID=2529275 RepID=A0A4Q9UYS7_9ACTO|nr:ABC transporter substrate-binding protein [Arcanobacterium bovis]TBW20849.1 prevent-host-death protein [Arcanobacterium bovis]